MKPMRELLGIVMISILLSATAYSNDLVLKHGNDTIRVIRADDTETAFNVYVNGKFVETAINKDMPVINAMDITHVGYFYPENDQEELPHFVVE